MSFESNHEDEPDELTGLTYDDQVALARYVAADIICESAGDLGEMVPMLAEADLVELVKRLNDIAAVLRSQAGNTGTDLWVAAQ